MNEIRFPDDVWQGTESHPQCCFLELFPSSQDPYETYFGEMFCHMNNTEDSAKICKGDYCKCPLSNRAIDPRLKEAIEEMQKDNRTEHLINSEVWRNGWHYGMIDTLDILRKHFPELKEAE